VLRDDKSYPYIYVTTEQEFPRFEFHRGSRKAPGRFFGPFPNAGAVRLTLQQIQKLFRVRQCTDTFFANRSRPCLQYQIHRCTGPCVGLIQPEEYRRDVENAMRFIEGRGADVLADLVSRMERSSANLEYERAARYRDQIADVRRVQEQQVIAAGAEADLDAVAVAAEKGTCCVAVLMIRGGRVLGSRCFFPRIAAGTPAAEVLSAFLAQHYLAQPAPAEILVDGAVEDAALLSATLGERAGHAVQVRQRVRGTRRRWIEMARENARQAAASRAAAAATLTAQLQELAEAVSLAAPPERIECFDISHTQGGETVASCVVFGPAGPVKSDYRRFNIRDVPAGDDYGALAQAVGRRYAKAGTADKPLPDLLLIDGGKGQLARVREVLEELGFGDVPTLAVAKGEGRRPGYERLYRPGDPEPLELPADSLALHLIQQVRDEAHRFAITGHRQRRQKKRIGSSLEEIAGLGPRRRRALLQQFGGLQGVARAGVEDLARTPGISRALAERIYGRFHEGAP
jgi:excinuclease ABC subunit C